MIYFFEQTRYGREDNKRKNIKLHSYIHMYTSHRIALKDENLYIFEKKRKHVDHKLRYISFINTQQVRKEKGKKIRRRGWVGCIFELLKYLTK